MAEENNKDNSTNLINCLTNKKVIVRYIVKPSNLVQNPKHVLYGGMADNAHHEFVVPVYASNGQYYNVLTNDEKNYLEYALGVEKNYLSIYKKEDNFWDNFKVTLGKDDTVLDLSNPSDYIKYKILCANKDFIAPSLDALDNRPLPTYRFVMIMEDEENTTKMNKLNSSMEAYMLLGRYMDNFDVLCTLLEEFEGRPLSPKVKKEAVLAKLQDYVTGDAKTFVRRASDPLLNTKVLIRNCVREKLILKKGNYYYLAVDNSPLCEADGEPVFSVAAKFLANPKRSDLKYTLEDKLKKK